MEKSSVEKIDKLHLTFHIWEWIILNVQKMYAFCEKIMHTARAGCKKEEKEGEET